VGEHGFDQWQWVFLVSAVCFPLGRFVAFALIERVVILDVGDS